MRLAALLLLASPAFAQPPGAAMGGSFAVPPETIIAARQSTFAFSAGTLIGMKATIDAHGDVKPWADYAGEMAEWAETIPTIFPENTKSGHDTRALPAIWNDRQGFAKAAATYHTAALALQTAAKAGDAAAFASAYKQVGQACGACHKSYRAKE